LLREPLQRHPPPYPGQRCGREGEKEAEGKSLEKHQGKEGQSPKGAEKLGKALGKPDEVQTPKPKAHEEARAETPLKEKGQNHRGQKAKGKRRKGKGQEEAQEKSPHPSNIRVRRRVFIGFASEV
jgi:hypothetical protein